MEALSVCCSRSGCGTKWGEVVRDANGIVLWSGLLVKLLWFWRVRVLVYACTAVGCRVVWGVNEWREMGPLGKAWAAGPLCF